MKKSILIYIVVLTACSIAAFGFKYLNTPEIVQERSTESNTVAFNSNFSNIINTMTDPELVYDVSSRFIHNVTKEQVDNAKSIRDLLPEKATNSIVSFQNVKLAVLINDGKEETIETGNSDEFTAAQLKLLKSVDYSKNLYVTANYKNKNVVAGKAVNDYLVYYMTVIPEQEAEFEGGKEKFIEYLKENSKEQTTNVQKNNLKPGRVNFTVSKEGTISKVSLSSTSGYSSLDDRMVELISTMTGKWNSATNAKGEKVDQELVFFFGIMGC